MEGSETTRLEHNTMYFFMSERSGLVAADSENLKHKLYNIRGNLVGMNDISE